MADISTAGELRVVVSGYYGFDNLGDEAVLYSLLAALREYCPGVRPVVLSHAPERTAALYGVRAVNRWRPGEIYRTVAGADLLISGGGSLLQDVTGLKSLLYYLGVIGLARFLRRPVVFYAQGIGPVRSRWGRLLMWLVANRVQLITVRDEQSARDLAAMGVTRPPVYVTADPVLGVEPGGVDPRAGEELLAAAGVDGGPVAGVSVREWAGFDGVRRRALAGVCDDLRRRGWRVLFIPLHYPEDLAVSRAVAALMHRPAAVLDCGLTVPQAVSLFGRLDLLIGMRLHALILAAVMNVPPVGIAYDPKIDRFLGQLGLSPAGRADALEYGALRQAVEKVLADPAGCRERLAAAVAPLRGLARRTALLTLEAAGKIGAAGGK